MGATGSNVIKNEVKSTARKAANSPLMEALDRLGYGTRGLIYIMMGILSLSVVLGKGGAPASQQGAIAAIGKQPAGLILLWIILLGLVSYALWGVIRAVLDPLRKGHDLKGLIARAGYLVSAASYFFLVPFTYGYITGSGSSGEASMQKSMASMMSSPAGHWAVVVIGLAVIANGLYQVYIGLNASFDKQFQTYAMNAKEIRWATQLGRFGTASRGVIFAIVGVLLTQAGLQSNPNQGVGFDSALTALLQQPYGVWLLGIVALGFMAFGVFSMLSAVWFRAQK